MSERVVPEGFEWQSKIRGGQAFADAGAVLGWGGLNVKKWLISLQVGRYVLGNCCFFDRSNR